jgi:1-acyl-sn-glycerol-3-phosphate acyltransferase
MLYAILFLLCALSAAWAVVALAHWHWLLGVLVFVLAFALMHALYVLFWWLAVQPVDRSKPLEKQNPRAREACRGCGRFLCLYGGVRPHISGEDKLPTDSRFLFVCNHRSMFDPLVVIAFLGKWNISFISKPSNMNIPLAGDVAYDAGYLAIDRENDRAALKTILTAADYMKRDLCSIGIYPEGTRTKDGELLPFHSGSFKTAQRAGVPIAVACIRGTEKVKRRLFLRPTDVYLDILELIPAERVKAMSTAELAEYSRKRIEKGLKQ